MDKRAQPDDMDLVVAIGVSRADLPAVEELLSSAVAGLPPGSAVAWLLVLAAAPNPLDSAAIETQLPLPVHDGIPGSALKPGHLLVISSGQGLELRDSTLVSASSDEQRGFGPIDRVFCSLAEQLGPRAVGVVLSGLGSDGAVGLERLSDSGALTAVQDPSLARVDSMPLAALATGAGDHVLGAAALGAELARYVRHLQRNQRPGPEDLREATRELLPVIASGSEVGDPAANNTPPAEPAGSPPPVARVNKASPSPAHQTRSAASSASREPRAGESEEQPAPLKAEEPDAGRPLPLEPIDGPAPSGDARKQTPSEAPSPNTDATPSEPRVAPPPEGPEPSPTPPGADCAGADCQPVDDNPYAEPYPETI